MGRGSEGGLHVSLAGTMMSCDGSLSAAKPGVRLAGSGLRGEVSGAVGLVR